MSARYMARKLAGLCVKCPERRVNRQDPRSTVYCTEHYEANKAAQRDRMRRLRKWWLRQHRCPYCSGKREAMPGVKWCAVCAEAHTERAGRKNG